MEWLPTPGTGGFVVLCLTVFAIVWFVVGMLAGRRK